MADRHDTVGRGFRATFKDAGTFGFWRNIVVYFCVFSVVGHLVEWPYCWIGATFFGSVPPDAEVLTNPLKPFFVYGFGITACAVLLVPYKEHLRKYLPRPWMALLVFYVISVFIGMGMELTQGFLQNQPVDGVYPLWDVHDHPGNILGQAWIVNDIFLGAIITVVVWVVYPACERAIAKLSERQANINALVIVGITAVITVITYFFWG
ncbi:MAG: hypothetical protein Q4E12_01015 [Coriobacteriia bacterium]|nr:hypothetical protein [Coriobacteriia bacterium]